MITPPVVRLRKELGFPGMVVLQWAFGGGPRNPHDPANHEEQSVVYTSTHDTDTTRGWFEALPKRQREATGLDPREPSWSLLKMAHGSRAALSVVRFRSNWRVIEVPPSVLREVISLTPEIWARCRSRGAATEAATVAGSAPGNTAETWIIG